MFNHYPKILIFTIFSLFGLMSTAQKTDTIVHVNGNVLLGEIKKLDNGIITFKMDGMGTIKFELDKVNTFSSNKNFQITVKSGMQYYGSFDTSLVNRKVRINFLNGNELIPIENIVEMYPIKKNFWLRTSGVFSLGFNYSKGSGIASLTSSGNLNYRNRKSYTILNFNENTTIQQDTITSNKSDITLDFKRVLVNKWYIGFNTEASSNSELGLDLRLLAGLSINNYLVQNYHNRLFLAAGFSGNREWANGIEDPTNSIEGLLGVNYHYFKYTSPEINISSFINAYPSFTTTGRWRVNYSLDAKVEVINDFHIGINFYYNADNKPLSADASTNDYGVTTTFSYSFH
ncbi:MAG: DUF481 domain-containing protein [Bacteroidota bacterium]